VAIYPTPCFRRDKFRRDGVWIPAGVYPALRCGAGMTLRVRLLRPPTFVGVLAITGGSLAMTRREKTKGREQL
jgi:hypothetical protein